MTKITSLTYCSFVCLNDFYVLRIYLDFSMLFTLHIYNFNTNALAFSAVKLLHSFWISGHTHEVLYYGISLLCHHLTLCVHCNWSESKAVDRSIVLNACFNYINARFLQRMSRRVQGKLPAGVDHQ